MLRITAVVKAEMTVREAVEMRPRAVRKADVRADIERAPDERVRSRASIAISSDEDP